MNVPHENSPVVGTPRTRSGGGSNDLIAARCTASSLPRNVFTSSRKVAVETVFARACNVTPKHADDTDKNGSDFSDLRHPFIRG